MLITYRGYTIDIIKSPVTNRYQGKIWEIPGKEGIISGRIFEEVQKIFLDVVDKFSPINRILH